MISKQLVHRKHMDLIHLEDKLHAVIAADLALVGWVLEVMCFDVFPYFLDGLGS